MSRDQVLTYRGAVQRKAPTLPAFVVVPTEVLAGWALEGTTTVHAEADGVDVGRRSLKRWDEERWFLELPKSALTATGLNVGDAVTLTLQRTSEELPAELREVVGTDPRARKRWESLSSARQRAIREFVFDAKRPETRRRRARRSLDCEEEEA